MRREGNAPTKIADDVVGALLAGMTGSFHGVASERAERCHPIAGPKEDGVGGVADVVGPGISASS